MSVGGLEHQFEGTGRKRDQWRVGRTSQACVVEGSGVEAQGGFVRYADNIYLSRTVDDKELFAVVCSGERAVGVSATVGARRTIKFPSRRPMQ